MQRIVLMGPPGSGKSTLARDIGARLGLPVFHLDQLFWQPGWVQTPEDQFAAAVERIAAGPRWVMDGNYRSALACRLAVADAVIFLDVPAWLSMLRIFRRTVRGFGRVRTDGPAGCPERIDFAFLRFAATWNRRSRARTLAVVESFPRTRLVSRRGEGAAAIVARLLAAGPAHSKLPPCPTAPSPPASSNAPSGGTPPRPS